MRKPIKQVAISVEAHQRLQQIAKENHASMSTTLNQMIFKTHVEHPEEIGQITFEDIEKKKKEGD